MAFEQSSAGLLVEVKGVGGDNSLEWIRASVALLGIFNRFQEKGLVPLEGELIHGIDHVHIEKHEVKGGGLLSDGSEVLTRVVNLLHRDLESLLGTLSFLRLLLGSIKGVDEIHVFKQRSLLILKRRKNFVL